jgi:hypothetical protein
MERPFVNNVDKFLSEFIKSMGGALVSEVLPIEPGFKNCDYYFEAENVLAELKCLEKDIFSDEDYERNERLIDKWLTKGIIKKIDLVPLLLKRKEVPQECLMEVLNLCRRTYETAIEKAHKQLKQTNEKLGNEKTQKVLFICNDGNYFLDDEKAYRLICTILAIRQEWNIDCFVLFTINQVSRVPGSDLDFSFWAPCYGDKAPDDLQSFINRLGTAFNEYYNKKFNIVETIHCKFDDVDSGLKAIGEQKHIPKNIIYKENS